MKHMTFTVPSGKVIQILCSTKSVIYFITACSPTAAKETPFAKDVCKISMLELEY